jgi:hypothetical protein
MAATRILHVCKFKLQRHSHIPIDSDRCRRLPEVSCYRTNSCWSFYYQSWGGYEYILGGDTGSKYGGDTIIISLFDKIKRIFRKIKKG